MNTGATLSVVIVEDQPLMRDRLIEFLGDMEGVRVVGTAASPDAAIGAIVQAQPDLVVLDYQLERGTALDVLRGAADLARSTTFAVITQHPTLQHQRACLAAGTRHYFDKSIDLDKLRRLVIELRDAVPDASLNGA